ncbi:MAG: DedA family protein [Nocardiopsaceae bacterium]|nr:DedA family protein [Nocardiopsaceae bacterium]
MLPKSVVPLPGFLAALAPVLNNYGYLAVGGLLLVEDFGVPVPGETVLIAASVYAGAGRLSVVGVGLIALLAAVVGDSIGYAIGRFGGRPLIERYGKYVLLTAERLDKAEAFFRRHGGKIVAVARFIDVLRQANGIIAGIAEMPWPKFLLFNAIGAAVWVACWTTVGYLAGNHIGIVYHTVNRYALFVGIAVAVLIIALIARAVLRRRRRRPAADPQTERSPAPGARER